MKISYNWLREYVAPGLAPEELAGALTMLGLEVDGVEKTGASVEGVVVGRVESVRPHPNADRLVLCDVDLGTASENGEAVQIACGAPNVEAGQKVPVATVGTTLWLPSRNDPAQKEPVTIQKTKLRGEVSEGMICAEDELGLSENHAGIMVLHESAEVGQPFADYLRAQGLEAEDAVLDIDLTPNRPDAASHLGVARDVAALTGAPLERPDVELPEAGGETAERVEVKIEAPEACPRYAALLVRGVEVKESPAWLKARLTAIGLRPRNVIVDITNFVMHECGQPLHAFDFEQIAGGQIVVRLSKEEEKTFTTLDGKARTLPERTLLICDAERPVALAGLMGGENSEVTKETTDVLIESAFFDPSTIRRTAKAMGLSTDASYRFERGVDREGQVWAAARAAQLMAEWAGGEVVPGLVDAHPQPAEARVVTLRPARANALLGTEIGAAQMASILGTLGFGVEEENPLEEMAERAFEGKGLSFEGSEVVLRCTVPPFRPDVEREEDLIEEVGRLWGYDRIPTPARAAAQAEAPQERPAQRLRRQARQLLSGLGFREMYTNSLLPQARAERFNVPALSGAVEAGAVVETLKPISQEMAALRPSLLPGALQVMQHNRNHRQRALRFFEFGHVFRKSKNGGVIPGYAEHESLLLALSGPHAAGWDAEPRPADVFDLKGAAETLLGALRVPDPAFEPMDEAPAPAVYAAAVRSGETTLGALFRLADGVAEDFDLDAPVFVCELDWDTLAEKAAPYLKRRYAPASRFPTAERDLAVVVDRAVPAGALLATLSQAAGPLLRHADVFDLYEGEGIAAGKKSVAFALVFGADRTLEDAEVDARIEAVTSALAEKHGAKLRR